MALLLWHRQVASYGLVPLAAAHGLSDGPAQRRNEQAPGSTNQRGRGATSLCAIGRAMLADGVSRSPVVRFAAAGVGAAVERMPHKPSEPWLIRPGSVAVPAQRAIAPSEVV